MSKDTVTLTYRKLIDLQQKLNFIDVSKKDELSLVCGKLNATIEEKLKKYNDLLADEAREFYAVNKDDDTFISDDKGQTKIMASKSKEYNAAVQKLLDKTIEMPTYICRKISKRALNLNIAVQMAFNDILFSIDLDKLYSQEDDAEDVVVEPGLRKLETSPSAGN